MLRKVELPEIELNQIKLDGLRLSISYTLIDADKDERKEITLHSPDEPLNSFKEALQNFLEVEIAFAGLDKGHWTNGTVSFIKFKHEREGDGLVIGVKRPSVCGDNFEVKGPLIPYSFAQDEKIKERIEILKAECLGYIDGQRKIVQLELLPGGQQGAA